MSFVIPFFLLLRFLSVVTQFREHDFDAAAAAAVMLCDDNDKTVCFIAIITSFHVCVCFFASFLLL